MDRLRGSYNIGNRPKSPCT